MAIEDNASIALIPSGYKNGKLYSVIPDTGNGDFTHTRGSTATRVNAAGLIETMPIDVPRLDYPLIDGVVQSCPALLLEPQRLNISRYSENFTLWSGGLVTADQATAPDGNLTADELTKTGAFSAQSRTETGTSGVNYVFSVFVKPKTTNTITLRQASGSNDVRRYFDLENETSGQSGGNQLGFVSEGIEKYPNGWYRVHTVCTSNSTSISTNLYAGRAGSTTYDGEVYIWGSQLEQGDYITSYIPNLSSGTTTRNADECNKTGVESLLGQTEGTLFLEFVPQNTSDLQIMFQIRTTGSTNVGQIDIRFQSGQIRALGSDNSGTTQFNIAGGSITAGTNYKAAIRYKTNDAKFYINGSSVGADTSCSFTSSTKQQISFAENLSSFLPSIKVKQLLVFKTALSDSDLATLTS